jgi:thiol-disulfide isomerase/thioredoxin
MACLLASALPVSAQTLVVGSDAPALQASQFVKGEKIERLEPSQTYVVEFWATWCGPCRTSIPHLTKLQKQYAGKVRFVGVSVWEQEQKAVEPFVKQMGDKMDYTVALDEVPKGETGSHGKMAESWMTASGSDGIPTAFVVKGGKIAWIGHPMELDQPLEKILEPSFDLSAAAAAYREERARIARQQSLFEKLGALVKPMDVDQKVALIDKAIAQDPTLEKDVAITKFLALVNGKKNEKAVAYGQKLVSSLLKDDAEALNNIAWSQVDPATRPARPDLKLALAAAERANEIEMGENGMIIDTLALVCFETGDKTRALRLQEKAVKLLGDNDEMKARLEMFRKAVDADKKP